MNFALTHDDGIALEYEEADVILVAVSRAGKTPTCVYLALHYGIRAANYPLTDQDLETDRLPPRLRAYRRKLFGLTIDPDRLHQIRQERRPNSRYAQLDTCKREVASAEAMFQVERIPTLSTTNKSIEEISSKVLSTLGLQREMF
jgi:regulator of PEP synthase PpsR (kinase-PPPase family)